MRIIKSSKEPTTASGFAIKVEFENVSGEELNITEPNIKDIHTATIKAHALLLEHGSEKTIISFKIPYIGINLSSIIKLSLPSYAIPRYQGYDDFIVIARRVIFTQNKAYEERFNS